MPAISQSKYLVECGWDDVPHLTEKDKAEVLASTPLHLKDAVSKGTASLGAGAIYPIPLSEIQVPPFKIPAFWPRLYGFDVGWQRTAALWLAHDRDNDTVYAYASHYRGQAEPSVHAASIKARGDWIPGAIDPASRGRSQLDGKVLLEAYRGQGLKLTEAQNAVEAGLFEVFCRLSTARLKFFTTLVDLTNEYRVYRRDEKGAVVKKGDHLMDALRYGIMELARAVTIPVAVHFGGANAADMKAGY